MITLLHGENTQASRDSLNQLKESAKGKEIRQIDGRALDTTRLVQALESGSLFGSETVVIIENLFGKLGRKQKLISDLASVIVRSEGSTQVILWEDKEIGASVIKSLGPRVSAQIFKTPVVIFQFLDALKPQNSKATLLLFTQALVYDAPELIFFLIVRRMRQLIMLEDGVTPDGLQGWQTARLTSQTKFFTMEKLLDMYKRLADLEYSIKSGWSPFSLTQQIELWLLDL